MGHARQHDSGDTATARRAEVDAPEAPSSPVPLPAGPVAVRRSPASAAAQAPAPPPDAAAELRLQPDADRRLASRLERLRALAATPLDPEDRADAALAEVQDLDLGNQQILVAVTEALAAVLPPAQLQRFLADVDRPRAQLTQDPTRLIEEATAPRRGLFGLRGPGVLLPVAGEMLRTPPTLDFDRVANALTTVEAFVRGLHTGISAGFTPEVANALAQRLQASTILNTVFPPVFLAGTAVGIATDAVDAVRGAYEMVVNFDELLEQANVILEIVVSPEGGELGRVFGEQIGRGWGDQLEQMSTKGVFAFTYELGKIAGPAIVYTICSFLGLPALAAGAMYARLSKALLPLLKRFPRLARLAGTLAKRLPQPHEPHRPHASHGPKVPARPHAHLPDGADRQGQVDVVGQGSPGEHPGFDEAFRESSGGHAAPVETRKTRSSHPTNPASAAAILDAIEDRMPALLADFEKSPASGRARLDDLEKQFVAFMDGKRERKLTVEERNSAMEILGPAREESRAYYERFRDFAWRRLNKDPDLRKLVEAPGSGADLGKGKKAGELEVVVSDAIGETSTQYRSIDFEHLTRVQDQPFRRHSEVAGQKRNLTPMLGDLNRYYQESLRDVGGAHKFGADAVEQFIVQHELYP